MISAKATIPVGVFMGNDIDIIGDRILHWAPLMGVGHVYNLGNHDHTQGEEIDVGLVRIHGSKRADLHVLDEVAFYSVYHLTGPIMKYWWFTFFINVYLKLLLHLQVAPIIHTHEAFGYLMHAKIYIQKKSEEIYL